MGSTISRQISKLITDQQRTTVRNSIVRVPLLRGRLSISNRRAEAVLHQLITNCSPLFADFHHWSCGDDYNPYNPICTACPHDVKESVEHMILRYVGRAASRRKRIGRIGGNIVEAVPRKTSEGTDA